MFTKLLNTSFPKVHSLKRPYSRVTTPIRGLKTRVMGLVNSVGILDGKPQVSVVTASVCPLETRGKNSRYSSLLASPFFLLLAFGIFAVIFLFLGHFETANFLPDHCSSPPSLELEERKKAVQLGEPSSTVILLHRENQQPRVYRHL